MLNHFYGITGVAGVLVTLVTSYLKNDELSRWILTTSGWFACLVIALTTAWGTRRISQQLIDHYEEHKIALGKIAELQNQTRELQNQRDTAQSISAFLAKNDYGKKANPRTIKAKTATTGAQNQ